MKHTEPNTTTLNATTGLFATLRALLAAKGTGAPKSTSSEGTGARSVIFLGFGIMRASRTASHTDRCITPQKRPDAAW